MSIEIEKITTDGMSIGFFRFGQGKRPMIIIPGLSIKSILLYKDAIAGAFASYAEDFEVYVFDRREDLPPVYTVSDMADDYIKAFDALGLKGLSLYGASQGGMISLTIAIKRPDLVSAMVIGSSASRQTEESKVLVAEWNRLAREENEDALIEAFASKVYSKAFYEAYKEPIVASVKGITKEEFRRFVILSDKMAEFDVFDSLDQINCPVLVMCGSDDAVLGALPSIEMAAKLACTVKVFDGFGHAVYDETEEYKTMAKDFLLSI